MSYSEEESIDPYTRERMRRRQQIGPQELLHQARFPHGVQPDLMLYPPNLEMTDVEKFLMRQHPHDYLAPNFQLGVMVKDRGMHEGLDAQKLVMKQSLVGLHRRSGFVRDNDSLSQDWRDSEMNLDDQVRVIDEFPITAGEWFARPLSVQFDRVNQESLLNSAEPGFMYYLDMVFNPFVAATAQRFPAANDDPPSFNFNNPIERIEVRNRSATETVYVAIDQDATVGTNGEFVVYPLEGRDIPIRAYRYISLITENNSDSDVRLTVFSYRDSHASLLNTYQRAQNFPTGSGMHPGDT